MFEGGNILGWHKGFICTRQILVSVHHHYRIVQTDEGTMQHPGLNGFPDDPGFPRSMTAPGVVGPPLPSNSITILPVTAASNGEKDDKI